MSKRTSKKRVQRKDPYEVVTTKILSLMEQAKGNQWEMPWNKPSVCASVPKNITGSSYHGINVPLLWAAMHERRFDSGLFGTYKQWKDKGCQVRKGEHGEDVVFFSTFTKEVEFEGESKEVAIPFAKLYTVFNASQVDGFEWGKNEDYEGSEAFEIGHCEALIENTGAEINHGGFRAFYRPEGDFIQLPEMSEFIDTEHSNATENYYSTMFHELTHWSGAPFRLDRTKGKMFGDSDYAFEELVAELGASFLCAQLGVTKSPRVDHAQYLKNWMGALKQDKKFFFKAASLAQKSTDYLMRLSNGVVAMAAE